MTISNFAEEAILNALFNNTALQIAQAYASLHTADPGETGASEAVGGSYARQAASFAAASGGAISNDADITFAGMPAATITHIGLWDAASNGNFLWGGAATASKTYGAGDTALIPSGDLDITLD